MENIGTLSPPVLEREQRTVAMLDLPKLRVAQAGVGRFGAERRSRMRETGLFDLVAAYDWNPEALALAVAEDGARPAGSYEELLDTPGLEAVIISTGAKFHAQQILGAMERGLHVFVEKPLCSTPAELRSLLDAQRQSGVVAAVGHTDHGSDAVALTTRSMIQNGELGKIAAVEITKSHSGGMHIKPGDWRGDPERNPGGMLFHCGVHAIYELLFYFGEVQSVACTLRNDVHTTATADVGHCLLTFASGLTAVLNTYHVSPYYDTLNIFGTEASLYRETLPGEISLWQQKRHPKRYQEPREKVELRARTDRGGNLRSFYQAVRSGAASHPSWFDGAHALNVVFAAVEAANSRCVVDIPRFSGECFK